MFIICTVVYNQYHTIRIGFAKNFICFIFANNIVDETQARIKSILMDLKNLKIYGYELSWKYHTQRIAFSEGPRFPAGEKGTVSSHESGNFGLSNFVNNTRISTKLSSVVLLIMAYIIGSRIYDI